MQIDQTGGKAKTMGCVDNLYIDKMILEDAHYHKKYLFCSWVDVETQGQLAGARGNKLDKEKKRRWFTSKVEQLKMMFKDIHWSGGLTEIYIKRSRLNTSGNNTMPTYDDRWTDPDHYKFLGKLQNTQHLDYKVTKEASKEYNTSGHPHCQFHVRSKLQTPTHYLHCSITCGQQTGHLTP